MNAHQDLAIFAKSCIFCRKDKCADLCSDASVRECAIERQDEGIVFSLELQLRVIAINPAAVCLQKCQYLCQVVQSMKQVRSMKQSIRRQRGLPTYNKLLAFVRSTLFAKLRDIRLMDLRDKLLQYMEGEGMTDVQASTIPKER